VSGPAVAFIPSGPRLSRPRKGVSVWFFAFIALLMLFPSAALAAPSVEATWRYEPAAGGRAVEGRRSIALPSASEPARLSTDPGITKTILLADVAKGVHTRLEQYEAACPYFDTLPRPSLCTGATRRSIAEALRTDIAEWSAQMRADPSTRSDNSVAEVFDLLRSLAKNMETAEPPIRGDILFDMAGPAPMSGAMAGALGRSLAVTGGGAQDFAFFRKLVKDGEVPSPDVLTVEGFLREFELPLVLAPACDKLLCVNLAAATNPEKRRLYVQLGMSSSVTQDTFHRKPLNLAAVLDISGSMEATDDTEKSRLEWAKDALIQTIEELNEGDVFSLVIFDTNSQILLRPERVRDKARIISAVRALSTRGSTNLEEGLRDGYELASENLDRLPNHEHRVILISDAGLNTGVTDPAPILKLVTDYASRGIGLTALGLGENFNQDFIHGIANSRGGNYVFVHSGKDMLRYFEAFNYLVTPVAYNFRVQLAFSGTQPRLVAAYGVATEAGAQPARNLIDIPTLFFSEEGGAILLEYELR